MQIEEAVHRYVVADPVVQHLCAGRVYPGQAPQSSELPVVVYGQASQQKLQTLAGVINLNAYSMTLELWAETFAQAKALYHALRDRLVGYRGELAGDVTVCGIFEDGGDDGAEPPAHDEETGLYAASLSLTIHYGN